MRLIDLITTRCIYASIRTLSYNMRMHGAILRIPIEAIYYIDMQDDDCMKYATDIASYPSSR